MDERTGARYSQEPRKLMDLCLNCSKPDCKGTCAQYRALRGAEPGKGGPRAIAYPGPDGLVLTLKEWEKRSGIPAKTLYNRVNVCGMTMQQAIEKGRRERPRLRGLSPQAQGAAQDAGETRGPQSVARTRGGYRGGPSRDEAWYIRFRELCRAYARRKTT